MAAQVVKLPPGWDRVVAAAERYEPALRRAYLATLEQIADLITVDEIVQALQTGRVEELVNGRLAEWAASPAAVAASLTILEQQVRAASRAGAEWLWGEADARFATRLHPEGLPTTAVAGPFTFDLARIDQAGSDWARTHATELIRVISDEARRTVWDLAVRAPIEGISVQEQARLIRQVIGLNGQQARAYSNRLAALTRDLPSMSGPQRLRAERILQRWYDRQIRLRAETIARTETARAQLASQQLSIRESLENGSVYEDDRVGWQASPLACPECLALEQQDWPPSVMGSLDTPHPNCRCPGFYIIVGERIRSVT